MRKIIYFALISLLCMVIPITASAASGSISIYGAGQAVAGNNINVTVTLSSGARIGSWQMILNYDESYLQLVGSNAEGGGNRMAASSTTGTNNVSYNFTFRALKSGTTSLNVGSYLAFDFDDMSEISLSSGSKSIRIITQAELEASYSKNNNLKNLEVEGFEIEPAFSKDNLDYSVIVPEGTEKINIIATREDGRASVSGAGEQEVSEGGNKFEIVVRAENGSEKKYTLNVEVKDKDPINVTVDGNKYTVVKLASLLTKPDNFEEKTIKISDKDIPAFYNKALNITLVGLKNEAGDIGLFIYDNGSYSKYNEIKSGSLTVYPKEIKKELKSFTKQTCSIQDKDVECLVRKKGDRFMIIYGVNVKTKEEGFYTYDKKDDTLMKFDEKSFTKMSKQNEMFMYAAALFGIIALISLISLGLIANSKGNKKTNKKIPDEKAPDIVEEKKELEKEKKTSKKNKKQNTEEIPEEINQEEKNEDIPVKEETEVYDIFEEEHSKKKRKKK